MQRIAGADVFLDTVVRFSEGDENSAEAQRVFADNLFWLLTRKAPVQSSACITRRRRSAAPMPSRLTTCSAVRVILAQWLLPYGVCRRLTTSGRRST